MLTIVLPVVVVMVVGVTFSLGYQEFEEREVAIGVVDEDNTSYAQAIVDAIRNQSARAIVYKDLEEARKDLVRERIDTIVQIDPWIAEKMKEFKKSYVKMFADESRPLLTAAIQASMLQAKQAAVDELVGQYVDKMKDEVIPRVLGIFGTVDSFLHGEQLGDEVADVLAVLAKLQGVDEGTIEAMADAAEIGFEQIMANGTPQERIIVSMIDRSAIVGALRGLAAAKPLLDSCYGFLRYIQPRLNQSDAIPLDMANDLSSFVANLSRITPEQAIIMQAALPLLKGSLVESLTRELVDASPEEIDRKADEVLLAAGQLMATVRQKSGEIANLSVMIASARDALQSADLGQLKTEAVSLLESVGRMEKGFLTSPIYLVEEPLYFGRQRMRYVDYISPGIFAFGILFSVLVYTVLSVVRDREKGILRHIFVCNLSRWNYVGGKILVCLGLATLQILILTACAILIFQIHVASIPKTLLFGIYSSIGFVGLGLLLSAVSKTEMEAMTASFGLCFIMLIVSGVFYPFELSPSIIRQASGWLPVRYVADLLRAGMIKDISLSEAAGSLAGVGVYGTATLLVGAIAFKWRKKG